MTQYAAIVVAAGMGKRTGLSIPKQFEKIHGKCVLDWSLISLNKSGLFSTVLVVLSPDHTEYEESLLIRFPNIVIIHGGTERADSVRNALAYLNNNAKPDFVFIHDAARPGLSLKMISTLKAALIKHDAVAPALSINDAIKLVSDEGELQSIDRSTLYRIQTPQAFRFECILDANDGQDKNFVDDLEAAQSKGIKVKLVEGETQLMKITHPEDFYIVSNFLQKESEEQMSFPRIGSGFDVHAFEQGNFVTLCGIKIAHNMKLKGHSDADVAWHALTDALYGALAQGDIGKHFPPSESQWKGVSSSVFLNHAAGLVLESGYLIANVDITIICETPKISPISDAMQKSTADLLKIPIDRVSIKATTTELLGFTGRKEGIAAQASVLLSPQT